MTKAGLPENPATHLTRRNITNLTPVRDAILFLSRFISKGTLHCHYVIVNDFFFKELCQKIIRTNK